jgi:hypothetical protein
MQISRMSAKTEMDQFFARNCYSEMEQEKVKASAAYQRAVESDDIIGAQEIATQVQESAPVDLSVSP